MFCSKYKPSSVKDLANAASVREIEKWLNSWKKGKGLLVHGPAGTGKSTALEVLAEERGYEILLYHSDELDSETLDYLLRASKQQSIYGKKKLIVIETVETGNASLLITLLKESFSPVCFITTDPYERRLYALRKMCSMIGFRPLFGKEIENLLMQVCKSEGIDCSEKQISQIAHMANGDLRAALIDLEVLAADAEVNRIGYREREDSIFETLRVIFKTQSLENARAAFDKSENADKVFQWLAENLHNEYKDTASLARAYDCLSKADVFQSRIIRRQAWALQKYFFFLMYGGVALSKNRPQSGFIRYNRPVFYYKTTSDAMNRIAKKVHTSSKKANAYRQLIKHFSDNDEFLGSLRLTKEEAEGL